MVDLCDAMFALFCFVMDYIVELCLGDRNCRQKPEPTKCVTMLRCSLIDIFGL